MSFLLGISKAWCEERSLTSTKTIQRATANLGGMAALLEACEFFAAELFPKDTHYVLLPASGLIDECTSDVMTFFQGDDRRRHVYHIADQFIKAADEGLSVTYKSMILAQQLSECLTKHLGDILRPLSQCFLLHRLLVDEGQYILTNKDYPETLFLVSWIYVDKEYILPEYWFNCIQWLPHQVLLKDARLNYASYDPLSRYCFT